MPSPPHLILRIAACLSASCLATGCSSSDARAERALEAYQAAAAANNLPEARRALLELVSAKDDVPAYWMELGKLQGSMGSYDEAYYAFTRAYELDRSNAALVRALTQLALQSGDLNLAQTRAQELDVLIPGDPWVKLTNGWVDLSEMRFDQALSIADGLLADAPLDPPATVLKARALFGLGREEEAIAFLRKHVEEVPSDSASMDQLAQMYERNNDWANAVAVRQRLSRAKPKDGENLILLAQAAFRAGKFDEGRNASFRLLRPDAPPPIVSRTLAVWMSFWPSAQRVDDARRLAAAAPLPQRLIYAAFISRLGDPASSARLIANSATLPVSAESAEANAVLGDALWRLGRFADAKSRFDAVIAFDPGNASALRGRAELEIKTGHADKAIADAQKLVTVLPQSADDRLLLARAYSAAGNSAWADRTLWTAFQDIPGNEKIYAGLLASRKGNPEATRELAQEFSRQRDASLTRGLL